MLVFDHVLGLAVAIGVGFGAHDLAALVLGNLLEAAIAVGVHGFPGDGALGGKGGKGAGGARLCGGRSGCRSGCIVAHEVDFLVAVGIEFFPSGQAAFIQADGLIEVPIAPGVPALLDGAVGGKQHQGVEAPVAVAVDLLAHPDAVLEACDSVVVSVGAGVAFLEHQDAPSKSLAEVEAGVPGGVQFVLSGVAVGIEVAPGVEASVEIPVLLVAGGGAALEMNPVVDAVVAVAILFEPLGLAL